tara:strand:- start:233 stop:460 length:228 start_codon:yes stop_codon:yes gene_type:complete
MDILQNELLLVDDNREPAHQPIAVEVTPIAIDQQNVVNRVELTRTGTSVASIFDSNNRKKHGTPTIKKFSAKAER